MISLYKLDTIKFWKELKSSVQLWYMIINQNLDSYSVPLLWIFNLFICIHPFLPTSISLYLLPASLYVILYISQFIRQSVWLHENISFLRNMYTKQLKSQPLCFMQFIFRTNRIQNGNQPGMNNFFLVCRSWYHSKSCYCRIPSRTINTFKMMQWTKL